MKYYSLEPFWDLDICALLLFGPRDAKSSYSEAFEVVWRTVKNFTRLNKLYILRLSPKGPMMLVSVSKTAVMRLLEGSLIEEGQRFP